jgi:Tfp pilus assembly protein PilO
MNLNKMPKDKRNNLILVVLLTAMALGGIGYVIFNWQYGSLTEMARKKNDAVTELKRMQDTIKRADQIETELSESSKTLSNLEEGMTSGDPSSWMVNTIRNFTASYKVVIPAFSQPLSADMNLLPKFPYKQVTVTVGGQGFYHDIGKFIADFENEFPYIRLCNLTIDPLPSLVPGEKEKLDFKMDIVSLIKPNP